MDFIYLNDEGSTVTQLLFHEVHIPENIVIRDVTLARAKRMILNFNNDSHPQTEANGSIKNPRSVHNLWSKLIDLVRGDGADSCDSRRVVYEWGIRHPFKASQQKLDFAFIPAKMSHLNWLDFSGGLEIKLSPMVTSGSKEMSGDSGEIK